MKVILFALSFYVCTHLYSQDAAGQHLDYIYKQGLSWRMNDQKLTAASLETAIAKSTDATLYSQRAKKYMILGGSLVVAGSLVRFISNKNEMTNNTISGWDVASFALVTTGLVFIIKSVKANRKANRLRNKEVMKVVY